LAFLTRRPRMKVSKVAWIAREYTSKKGIAYNVHVQQ